MIPLHRPDFGIGTVTISLLNCGERGSVEQLERDYAAAAGVKFAIWLPSARAGIGWALRAAVNPQTTVAGPAFTCAVVHEAMRYSGGGVQLIDIPPQHFLLSQESLSPHQTKNHALVLCEVFGHVYDLAKITKASQTQPVVRIVDMAMAMPHAGLFQRLESNDFGVISFGAGKSMYAGWGAMGFTTNAELAKEVVLLRNASIGRGNFRLLLSRMANVSARLVGSHPAIYALAKKIRDAKHKPIPADLNGSAKVESASEIPPKPASAEWHQPSTHLDRGLAKWNLRNAHKAAQARIALAKCYSNYLRELKGVTYPKSENEVLSHFTIRLDARIRNRVKQHLQQNGINTVTFWTFPDQLKAADYPETHKLGTEILNLPLSPWMSESHVESVCGTLQQALKLYV